MGKTGKKNGKVSSLKGELGGVDVTKEFEEGQKPVIVSGS